MKRRILICLLVFLLCCGTVLALVSCGSDGAGQGYERDRKIKLKILNDGLTARTETLEISVKCKKEFLQLRSDSFSYQKMGEDGTWGQVYHMQNAVIGDKLLTRGEKTKVTMRVSFEPGEYRLILEQYHYYGEAPTCGIVTFTVA
ncbi:MAG: hypothetical protein IJX39_00660 [Clostridia bacterium]|nr:hypothetical protein [Clostridia bacterium]